MRRAGQTWDDGSLRNSLSVTASRKTGALTDLPRRCSPTLLGVSETLRRLGLSCGDLRRAATWL